MLNEAHKKVTLAMALAGALALGAVPQVQAQSLSGTINRSQPSATQRFFARHPKVKTATLGSGVGTAAGALTGLISGKGVFRGAAIGAGTGASVGLIGSSEVMKKHPIVRDTTVGTITGAGIALSSTKRGKVKNMTKGAGVGAAMGVALGLLRTGLN